MGIVFFMYRHYAYGSLWFIMEDVLDSNGNIKEQIDMNLIQLPKNLPKNLVISK